MVSETCLELWTADRKKEWYTEEFTSLSASW